MPGSPGPADGIAPLRGHIDGAACCPRLRAGGRQLPRLRASAGPQHPAAPTGEVSRAARKSIAAIPARQPRAGRPAGPATLPGAAPDTWLSCPGNEHRRAARPHSGRRLLSWPAGGPAAAAPAPVTSARSRPAAPRRGNETNGGKEAITAMTGPRLAEQGGHARPRGPVPIGAAGWPAYSRPGSGPQPRAATRLRPGRETRRPARTPIAAITSQPIERTGPAARPLPVVARPDAMKPLCPCADGKIRCRRFT